MQLRRTGTLTKADIIAVADSHENGNFISDPDYREQADLNGQEARRYLESRGFVVVANGDTGRFGYAQTACGLRLSTNGHVTRVKK